MLALRFQGSKGGLCSHQDLTIKVDEVPQNPLVVILITHMLVEKGQDTFKQRNATLENG